MGMLLQAGAPLVGSVVEVLNASEFLNLPALWRNAIVHQDICGTLEGIQQNHIYQESIDPILDQPFTSRSSSHSIVACVRTLISDVIHILSLQPIVELDGVAASSVQAQNFEITRNTMVW